ncbi:hypothetical protein [Aliivibrio fischeri]|uniref:hypothetical protein n=1 Tax=Aliivibrio fischeri TaxID=668 RepID=UPI00080E4D99|nr:hypothetical protein [Aliivibrio fischeri]OCH11870.1 hypothetical protein A6E09_18915 [Aliivibrio fischeri]
MDIKIVVALIGISGVLASAIVQYLLGSKMEKSKKQIEVKSQAYLDFLNAVSEIASSAQYSEKRSVEQLQRLNQAKTRVILIGSKSVVEDLHVFFKDYGTLNSDDAYDSFSKIVKSMRNDLSGKDALNLSVICEALFGIRAKA